MKPLITQDYKGFTIEIHYDPEPISPDEWSDNGLFLVSGHPDLFIKHDLIKEDPRHFACRRLPKIKLPSNRRMYYVFTLYGYSHSGVGLSLSNDHYPFNCPWDGFFTGTVFASAKEFRTQDKARIGAQGLVDRWNNHFSGNVYGFQVLDKDGEHVDSCWGFEGDSDYALSQAKENVDGIISYNETESLASAGIF
jgi:hypothetical protein